MPPCVFPALFSVPGSAQGLGCSSEGERYYLCPLVVIFGRWGREMSRGYHWWPSIKQVKERQRVNHLRVCSLCARSLDGVLWATAALRRCGDPCEEGLKPGGRESRKTSLSLGDLPPSRASLAIGIHFWDDYLPSCTHQIGNHSQKAVTGNYAAWEWRVMPKYASDKCDGVFRKKEGKREK